MVIPPWLLLSVDLKNLRSDFFSVAKIFSIDKILREKHFFKTLTLKQLAKFLKFYNYRSINDNSNEKNQLKFYNRKKGKERQKAKIKR